MKYPKFISMNAMHSLKLCLIHLIVNFVSLCTYAHKDIHADLQFWPVNENDIASAQCRYPVATNNEQIKLYFKNKLQNEKIVYQKRIFGLTFKNEKIHLLDLFYKLTEAASNSEEADPTRQVNLIKTYPNISKCTKVTCATEILFGQKEHLKTLYLLSKFRLNTSHLRYIDSAQMSDQELSDIIYAMSYIPEDMAIVSSNQKLTRYLRDPNLEANKLRPIMNHTMTIFKRWDEFNTISKVKIIFHEYAHIWSQEHNQDLFSTQKWLQLSKWQATEKEDTFTSVLLEPKKKTNGAWVSEYAQRHPAEDFAEAVTAYRLVPQYLQDISPAKYAFIKMYVFNGREFKTERDCNNQNLFTAKLFKEITNEAYELF